MKDLHDVLDANEHADFYDALTKISDRSVRLHAKWGDSLLLPFDSNPIPWHPLGRWVVEGSIRPGGFLHHAIAQYYIQDAASLLALTLLDTSPGELVLDLCAAPGGKASSISESLGPDGMLVANEVIRSRVDVLHYALARSGQANFVVTSLDPDAMANSFPETFDAILVDAPCSGQTLVGRKKRDANAFDPKQIAHCASRQNRILAAAIRMLRPGGRIVYSTCTFAIEENEAQIETLCQQFGNGLEPMDSSLLAPWKSPLHAGCYRLWPHRDRCAGGFAAGLRLRHALDQAVDDDVSARAKPDLASDRTRTKPRGANPHPRSAPRDEENVLATLGALHARELHWTQRHARVLSPTMAHFMQNHPSLDAEPLIGMVQVGKRWVPSHGLVMIDRDLFQPLQSIELDDSAAKAFCRGSAIDAPTEADPTSRWLAVNWNQRPLGWSHIAGTRLNNHLPAWARWT